MVLIKRGDLDIRMHTEARGHNKKVAIPKPMGRTSGKTKPTDTFILDYWPQHKKIKNLLFKPDYFWKSKQTNTYGKIYIW